VHAVQMLKSKNPNFYLACAPHALTCAPLTPLGLKPCPLSLNVSHLTRLVYFFIEIISTDAIDILT